MKSQCENFSLYDTVQNTPWSEILRYPTQQWREVAFVKPSQRKETAS
jgi:hypothetical protein